jgi:3-hydroxypropanoate dehydrogenase
MEKLNNMVLDQLFHKSRTMSKFQDKEVSDEVLKELYTLMSMGPTAFNAQPTRLIFIKSPEAKERLKPLLMAGNVEKTMKAPVTVIVATDYDFHNLLPKTFPVADVKGMFDNNTVLTESTGFRNSSLAGGYLMIAARALGLDGGAMSGFNSKKVEEEFFAGTNIRSNFLINLGYGDYTDIQDRLPRLTFEEASKII